MRSCWLNLVLLAALAWSAPGAADEPSEQPEAAPTAPATEAPEALAAFVQGTELARQARWAQALASFERAAQLKPHAITTYNIGACERAIGRYTRARMVFAQALAQHEASGGAELPDSLVAQTRTFLAEIDDLLARVTLTVVPDTATIAVDGRPLERLARPAGASDRPRAIAGTRPAGEGERVPAGAFEVLLDPGAHVFTLTRRGFAPAVLNRSYAPKARASETLELDRLPATLKVSSNEAGAIVYLDDRDVGPAPVEVKRPAGSYRVAVEKDGFVTYEAVVDVGPGEEAKLRANLVEESVPIVKRWWFWASAAATLATGAVVTYFVTRPEPEPPPYDGGSSGWVVFPQVAIPLP